jgi:uncharacterized protein YejL (UPF0352 family)
MPKDDILTLKLPGANLVFTRYLYIKDEVKTALLLSILNKSDDAIFWAYELYYSGFKNELYAFIWKIYYDFFATLNPSFSVYLSKKFSNKDMIEDRLISSIIQNLLIRSFNTDVFLLRTISELFEADAEESVSLECRLDNEDYRGLAQDILNNKELDEMDVYQRVLNYFKLTNQQKLIKDLMNEMKTNSATTKSSLILVANILSLINQSKGQSQRKNFYVRVDPEEVVQYETIEAADNLKSYRILAQACVCKIGNQSFQNLFQSFRNKYDKKELKEKYNGLASRAILEKYNSDKWLYHASFSPMWFSRIKSCKGYIDYEKNEVKFISEDWEEEFHNRFGLEPDEQPLYVKENALKLENDNNANLWQHFFAAYKKNGMIDALEEEQDALNEEPLKYA